MAACGWPSYVSDPPITVRIGTTFVTTSVVVAVTGT
jgi:hypothetical protein